MLSIHNALIELDTPVLCGVSEQCKEMSSEAGSPPANCACAFWPLPALSKETRTTEDSAMWPRDNRDRARISSIRHPLSKLNADSRHAATRSPFCLTRPVWSIFARPDVRRFHGQLQLSGRIVEPQEAPCCVSSKWTWQTRQMTEVCARWLENPYSSITNLSARNFSVTLFKLGRWRSIITAGTAEQHMGEVPARMLCFRKAWTRLSCRKVGAATMPFDFTRAVHRYHGGLQSGRQLHDGRLADATRSVERLVKQTKRCGDQAP